MRPPSLFVSLAEYGVTVFLPILVHQYVNAHLALVVFCLCFIILCWHHWDEIRTAKTLIGLALVLVIGAYFLTRDSKVVSSNSGHSKAAAPQQQNSGSGANQQQSSGNDSPNINGNNNTVVNGNGNTVKPTTVIQQTDPRSKAQTDAVNKLLEQLQKENSDQFAPSVLLKKYPLGYSIFAMDYSQQVFPYRTEAKDFEVEWNTAVLTDLGNAIQFQMPTIVSKSSGSRYAVLPQLEMEKAFVR